MAAEATPSPSAVVLRFLLPALAAGAAAAVIGFAVVGLRTGGFSYKLGWAGASGRAGVTIAFALAYLWVLAQAAYRLAPRFGARPDPRLALVTLAHAPAPVFLASLLLVWPAAYWLWPLPALWSVYVLHCGLVSLMRPDPSRAVPYTAAILAVAILLLWIVSLAQCTPIARLLPSVVRVELPAVDPRAGQPADAADAARGGQSESGASGVAAGASGSGQLEGGTGTLDLSRTQSGGSSDALAGVLHGGSETPTRTVLDTFLPGAIDGFERQVVDNFAYLGQANTATMLARGAYVRVNYSATDRSRRSMSVAITDLTPELGPSVADTLLAEIARTGGESATGRIRRTVVDADDRLIVTEFSASADETRQFGFYEVLLGSRYVVRVEGQGLSLEALRSLVAGLDLAGLEARAKARKPVE